MNFTPSTQIPLAPDAGFVAAVPTGEEKANKARPSWWRAQPYPGRGTWERHVWARGQKLTAPAKAVLRCLVDYDWSSTPVFPSIATIADETNLSLTAVKNALRWLKAREWITTERRKSADGGWASNCYTIASGVGVGRLAPKGRARDALSRARDDHEEERGQERVAGATRSRPPPRAFARSERKEEEGHEAKIPPDLCDPPGRCRRAAFVPPGGECLTCGWRRPG